VAVGNIATLVGAGVALVAALAFLLWGLKRLRKARLEVRLDESASLEERSPLPAGYYRVVGLRFFVSNVGRANAREASVWLRFDMDQLVPHMSTGSEPTTVDDFEISRVDLRSIRLRSVNILPRSAEPATTEVPVEVRRAGPTEIAYRATCQNCAGSSEGTFSFTVSEAEPRESPGPAERPDTPHEQEPEGPA
jgi:hypothetical protein